MRFKRYIIGLAIAAGLVVPATASAATGTVAIQSVDGSQVTANATITVEQAREWWFAYATQVDGAQPCSPSSDGVVWLSTIWSDGSLPRDYNGAFTSPGTYSTTITFTATHSPETKLCIYTNGPGLGEQLVAEAVANMAAPSGQYRIGAICNDGWHSTATGSGACSSHGGVRYWLYSGTTPTPTPTPTPIPYVPATTPLPPSTPTGIRTGAVCKDGSRSSATGSGACSHHGGVRFWITENPAPPVVVAPEPQEINPNVICNDKLVKTPRSCSIRTGRVKLTKLSWSSWDKTAKGTGKVSFDGSKLRKATITLSQRKGDVYTEMTIKMAHNRTRHLTLRVS